MNACVRQEGGVFHLGLTGCGSRAGNKVHSFIHSFPIMRPGGCHVVTLRFSAKGSSEFSPGSWERGA